MEKKFPKNPIRTNKLRKDQKTLILTDDLEDHLNMSSKLIYTDKINNISTYKRGRAAYL